MRIKVDADPATLEALQDAARREVRPLDLQALVALRRGLGLPESDPDPTCSSGVVIEEAHHA